MDESEIHNWETVVRTEAEAERMGRPRPQVELGELGELRWLGDGVAEPAGEDLSPRFMMWASHLILLSFNFLVFVGLSSV